MSTNRYTFAVTWYFLRVNVGRQIVLKIQCIVRHLNYSFRHSQKCFLSQLTESTGHVWRLGIHVSMYDGLPSRRSLLRHSRGLSDDPSTHQARAVRSVTLQEEQQAAPSRHAQKPFSSTFTDGTIIKRYRPNKYKRTETCEEATGSTAVDWLKPVIDRWFFQ